MFSTSFSATIVASPLRIDHDGQAWVLHADVELDADVRTVWQTITDYDSLPRFVPGIDQSRVVTRRTEGSGGPGERLTIEQSGVLRFWLFVQPIRVRLDVRHDPLRAIDAHLIPQPPSLPAHGGIGGAGEAGVPRVDDGSDALRTFEGHYRLTALGPSRMRLVYDARLVPHFDPRWLGGLALRRTMAAQFDALLVEIARRQGAASK